jgi:hypothetical protein
MYSCPLLRVGKMVCLDADTLCAFAEGRLAGQALADAERHIDACEECRLALAALAGHGAPSTPAPGDLALEATLAPGPRMDLDPRASRRPMMLSDGAMVDHFKVIRLAGRGGMGEVYLARDTLLGRKVALKLVNREALGDEEAVSRFLQEARTTAQFSHPHIVTVHSVGEVEIPAAGAAAGASPARCPYVALEYLEGQTLRERIDAQLPGSGRRFASRWPSPRPSPRPTRTACSTAT